MKKYLEYVALKENEEYPFDEELKKMYPDLEYPGQRKHQWHNDNMAKTTRAQTQRDNSNTEIDQLREREKKELLVRLSDMLAVAYKNENEDFIEELTALIENYPELVRDINIKPMIMEEPAPPKKR